MIRTSRISSGFDVEFQLGGEWFRTALNLLNDNGLLAPEGVPVIITAVRISFQPGWDLEIDVAGLPAPVLARVSLNEAGSELTITANLPMIPEQKVPFGALSDLAEPPVLVKLPGDEDHEPVLAIVANLDIQAGPQSEEPLPEGEFLERGDPALAQSFLPLGRHIAFGMGKETYKRFANNVWHTELRAEDGTHPLPDAENKAGDWSRVRMTGKKGQIRLVLEGDIPVDSPIIDVVPDPHVTITLLLTPQIEADGRLTFSIETDTDIDTGLLGDLFAGITGALVGFIVGLFTGGILVPMLIGAVAAIIVLEVAEVVVEGIVQKEIKARLDGETLPDLLCCRGDVVQVARPDPEQEGFNLSILDAIPAAVAVDTSNQGEELLYKQSLLVTSIYQDLAVNANGFAVAGSSGTEVRFQPEAATLDEARYEGDELVSLTYRRSRDGRRQSLPLAEVLGRAGAGELKAPFKIFEEPEAATFRIPAGRLPCPCLTPTAIHQVDAVVQEIEFDNGLRMRVPDVIALQDAAALVVTGYQLIHPRDYHAYYRAKADLRLDNNFESLPKR